MELATLTVPAGFQSVDLPAQLTGKGGKPVAGAELEFHILTRLSSGQEGSFPVGVGKTDADGQASQTAGKGLLGRNDSLIGYAVSFRPLARIGGVQYCAVDARTSITVTG